ncbi:MAG: ABC transporter ATP-binding protein [Deltaproteobacteria bacterium]|nr:ABC transporter ATP-binding protein [Deltaproteobacteria bacterium]
MGENIVLEARGLTKSWSSGFASGPSDLVLRAGETLGILGLNGAGKSTLFQMLSGNLDADSGELLLNGSRLHPEAFQLKRKIGYLPQNMLLPRWATGQELLTYAVSLYQLEDPLRELQLLMEYWDCYSYRDKPLETCSHGMQKRIALALSCIHTPDLLILDEPFSGLDLCHMASLKHKILQRQKAGLATILSTHIAPYVASLCSDIRIIRSGCLSHPGGWADMKEADRVCLIEEAFQSDHSFLAESHSRP